MRLYGAIVLGPVFAALVMGGMLACERQPNSSDPTRTSPQPAKTDETGPVTGPIPPAHSTDLPPGDAPNAGLTKPN